jgi:hypothetical protein
MSDEHECGLYDEIDEPDDPAYDREIEAQEDMDRLNGLYELFEQMCSDAEKQGFPIHNKSVELEKFLGNGRLSTQPSSTKNQIKSLKCKNG